MRPSAADNQSVSASFYEKGLLDLRDLGDLFAGSISVKDAFRCVANRVCQFFNSGGARLFLLNQNRKHLVETAVWGSIDDPSSDTDELPLRCFSSKRIMLDTRNQLKTGAFSVAVPLTRGNEPVGVLQMYLRDSDTPPDQLTLALADIEELVSPVIVRSMIYERSMAKAHVDAITVLPNERAFDMLCGTKIAEARRMESALSIIVIDIRDFAVINERFGHVAGDALLRWVALTAQNNLRDMDVIARSHNDEFMVVLPTASKQETLVIISRIRENIALKELPSEIRGIRSVELNFGWAEFGSDGDSTSSLLTRARLRKDLSKGQPAIRNVLLFPTG